MRVGPKEMLTKRIAKRRRLECSTSFLEDVRVILLMTEILHVLTNEPKSCRSLNLTLCICRHMFEVFKSLTVWSACICVDLRVER